MNKYVRYVFVEFNKVHFYGLQRTFVNSRGFGPVEAMMTSVWFDTCVGPGRYHPRLMLWGRTVSIGEIGTETQNLSCSTKQVLKDSYWIPGHRAFAVSERSPQDCLCGLSFQLDHHQFRHLQGQCTKMHFSRSTFIITVLVFTMYSYLLWVHLHLSWSSSIVYVSTTKQLS